MKNLIVQDSLIGAAVMCLLMGLSFIYLDIAKNISTSKFIGILFIFGSAAYIAIYVFVKYKSKKQTSNVGHAQLIKEKMERDALERQQGGRRQEQTD